MRATFVALVTLALAACTTPDHPIRLEPAAPLIDSAAAAALAPAAVTGGDADMVAWGYRFRAGDRLRIGRRYGSTNRRGSPRFLEGHDEVLLDVESVDASGIMTVTMTTLRNSMREKSGPEHPMVKSSYAARMPKVRARVDRVGNVFAGVILEATEDHERWKQMKAQDSANVHMRPDSSLVRHELADALPRLAMPSRLRIGTTYRDTVVERRRSRGYVIDTSRVADAMPGNTGRPTIGGEAEVTYWEMTTVESVTPIGWVEHEGRRYLKVERTFHRVEPLPPPAGITNVYEQRWEYLVDERGALVRGEMIGTNTMNGEPEGTNWEVVEVMRDE